MMLARMLLSYAPFLYVSGICGLDELKQRRIYSEWNAFASKRRGVGCNCSSNKEE